MEKKRHPGSIPWFKEEPEDRIKAAPFYPPDEPEWPCPVCDEGGEMELVETRPGYRESIQIYECSECGHRESFP